MDEVNIHIIELTNGLKVVNLIENELHFVDGTIVPPTHKRLRISTLRRNEDPPNFDEWVIRADDPTDRKIRLLKANSIPFIDDVEWLKRNIPVDALVLTGRAKTEIFGFPCVTPVVSHKGETALHHIDVFMWN